MTERLKKVAETTVNALGYTLRPHCTCVDEHGVAAQGYDVVAYYDEHAAFQGRESDTAEFNYALYWFKNGGNAIKFTASPGLYAPMCGGYCAMACAEKNQLVPGDPRAWCIHQKKLYFFANKDDVKRFLENADELAAQAEKNFVPLAKQVDKRMHGMHGPAGPKMGMMPWPALQGPGDALDGAVLLGPSGHSFT
eukprot:CAMPEP_0183833432 /NCGR_PEP_ID=MMETSP0807_2-20130328/6065_1 /TAXON_ID=88271 /ORGANISM="Picocystis salinarum, Strain CCMP1897" /LENGTH=193 /DNA_ID=CAMNT_0026079379 /DNA_START=166 /DNA_END=746 /DNA_ORIENTATION=-